jgi:hypothetical protein
MFEIEKIFAFEKQRIDLKPTEKILKLTLENIADTENLCTIHKENGEIKVMSERILAMIEEYELNRKVDEEEEEEELPPPPPPRNAFQRFLMLFERQPEPV